MNEQVKNKIKSLKKYVKVEKSFSEVGETLLANAHASELEVLEELQNLGLGHITRKGFRIYIDNMINFVV
jgi:hypothetical protein